MNIAFPCEMDPSSKNPSRILPKEEKIYKLYLGFSTNLFLVLSLFTCRAVAGHSWDGVAVTQANYQALRAIKHELIDFSSVLRTWNDSGYGACSGGWAGIRCLRGQVIAIQLPWKGLGGRISEEIGQLSALRKLSLHDNVIGGSVPHSLGFLRNLHGLHLFNNRLSGSIPASIGNCPLLQNLDLSNNQLSGSIPAHLAESTRLYRLNLSYNLLSGPLPISLTSSSSYTLTFLDLQHNNLSGSISDSWGGERHGNVSQPLKILNLNHNLFSGYVPRSLGKLVLLEQISLSHNQISGAIPGELGSLSNLQSLDLSFNSINGTIPESFFINLSSLASLNLENNRLNGQVPDTIDGMQNLTLLNLKRNEFEGHIPETIGNISRISQLDLSENNFTGPIPPSLISLENLSSLNVSFNGLSGPVPTPLTRKFNSSSFMGNLQLCGYSASNPCPSPTHPLNQSHPPTEQPRKHHHHRRKLSAKDIILIAIGALLALLLLLCIILFCCLMKKRSALKQKEGKISTRSVPEKAAAAAGESASEMGGKLVHFDGPFVFTADDLLCATAEIMGKSTYGTAYKATLEDGNEVAVKRLREKTTKGVKEFEAEVAALGRIRHPNLLALRAYYLGPKGEKLLVFDYMPKGSLSSFLHARGPETLIPWETRMKIAKGIARGLSHLHTKENMIHENLTASNILLDEQTKAHIADYGFSRLMTAAAATNVIATAGTLGYRAPELSKIKNASTKTDVYSLGVIILELLTGKSPGEPTNGMDLPQWVASIVKEEWTNEVFDLELMGEAQSVGDELLNTLKLALHCVDPSPAARPEAGQLLQELEEIRPEMAEATGSGDEGAKEEQSKDE
ncbi:PREDICTED: probably inactive leucine-rich repeat receptor-like protein kinase IMK2 [Tarenaya hassleriana]|uniref:probably inactive leucine-rich repeat receptor-like protein kinase IMK2 n=1 Tax=Tarenaya hassleriana TaxID=28532 RepID=UPI00053C7C3C|nr:PREDICTED: probably inactive leucine-rich repeat receptor-like protein kinase IMK2 [Tarenaya hassleriana]